VCNWFGEEASIDVNGLKRLKLKSQTYFKISVIHKETCIGSSLCMKMKTVLTCEKREVCRANACNPQINDPSLG
jgi:hypothetical protein